MLSYKSGTTGEMINLSGEGIFARIKKAGFYDYEWKVLTKTTRSGVKVTGFSKEAVKYKVLIDFKGKKEERAKAAEKLFRMIETDISEMSLGKLMFKGFYIECYVIGSNFVETLSNRTIQKEFTVYAPNPCWIKEENFSFERYNESPEDGYLEFPYDFPFEYTSAQKGMSTLNNDHYADTNFKMTIYGPVVNPVINIGNYPYEVNTTVEANEYLVIDSTKNAVKRTLTNGTIINEYNRRSFENSVFRPIPPGNHNVLWSGDFGWDITLYQERSEPKW